MDAIFDPHGRTVGWLRDDIVFDAGSQPVAFVRNGPVFSYAGHYLGRLDRGFFRDVGHAVAFMRGASGGPAPPVPAVPPVPTVPPVPPVPPLPPLPPVPPVPPVPSLSWSPLTWDEFISG